MFGKDKKEKKPKSKARKIIEWVITGVLASLMVGLAVIQIINRTNENQNVFGTKYQRVLTDSMSPVYKVSDIIVVKKVSPEIIYQEWEEGKDVDVSFKWVINGKTVSMTHRIKEVQYSEPALIDSTT